MYFWRFLDARRPLRGLGMTEKRAASWVCTAIMSSFIWSCGLSRADYENYDSTTPAANEESEACKTALATFEATIQPVVKNTCAVAGCHAATTIGGSLVSASDAKTSRKTLKGFTGTTSTKLFEKISLVSSPKHGGDNQSAALPKATIDAWLTKEADCK